VGGLKAPHLAQLGLAISPRSPVFSLPAAQRRLRKKAPNWPKGKTPPPATGKWRHPRKKTLPTYHEGFPTAFIDRFVKEAKIPGILGNIPASGTEIIQQLGGRAHEKRQADCLHQRRFGFPDCLPRRKLWPRSPLAICKVARHLCDELGVARVIARPFVGAPGSFHRTTNRKDFSVALPKKP